MMKLEGIFVGLSQMTATRLVDVLSGYSKDVLGWVGKCRPKLIAWLCYLFTTNTHF